MDAMAKLGLPNDTGRWESKLREFRRDLLNVGTSAILRKYIHEGESMVLDQRSQQNLVSRVSRRFEVDPREVLLVGSGLLGFSIKPGRRYQFFGDTSDIDVTVISKFLFETIWREAFDYERSGAFWERKTEFQSYLGRGWIRPDMLPNKHAFEFAKKWWGFFDSVTQSREFGPYKIRGAVYHSPHFFDAYQRICVDQCKQEANSPA